MSALPPKPDVVEHDPHVRFVPKADVNVGGQKPSKVDITPAMLEPEGLE
jgi:hypothetical protein